MDTKRYVREFLKAHPGKTYSQNELALEINEYDNFDIPIKVHPEEVLKHGRELAKQKDRFQHYKRSGSATVTIDGQKRLLLLDNEYLRYDVVADLAEDRLSEIEGLHGEELMQWIIDELADEVEDSVLEHHFKYEGRGWGGPD